MIVIRNNKISILEVIREINKKYEGVFKIVNNGYEVANDAMLIKIIESGTDFTISEFRYHSELTADQARRFIGRVFNELKRYGIEIIHI